MEKFGACSAGKCPECEGAMERIISPVGVIFKGSGFHINDYKREGTRKEPKAESPSTDTETTAPKTENAAEAKSEGTAKEADKSSKSEDASSAKESKEKKKKKEKVA
jgi:predicted nucleic acid-binding Zn ribbon protein